VIAFLIAWALIDLVEAILYWGMARHLCPQAINLRNLRDWRQAASENKGLFRFALMTHAGGTIDAIMRHGPLLAVGALVGTKAAGLYRLASQLTQALGKLSALLTRSVYAEVAHVKASARPDDFRRLAIQVSAIAASAGVVTTGLAWLLGAPLLELIGGPAYQLAAPVLIPLAVAASFELASVAFEPVLHSSDAAGRAFLARIVGVITMSLGILVCASSNAQDIAWSVAAGSSAAYIALAYLAFRHVYGEALSKRRPA
jgi:O-antigen/teichoic acid export membrane protein